MVKRVIWAALLLLSAQAFLSAAQPIKPKADELAVNFNLMNLENKQVFLSDFKNKPVILFFWTTWCPYCRKELKILNDMYGKLAKDGVELLAIDIGESSSKVDNFTKGYNLNLNILLDKDTVVADVYNILGVPTYIFIDKKGKIISANHSFSQEIYNKLISK